MTWLPFSQKSKKPMPDFRLAHLLYEPHGRHARLLERLFFSNYIYSEEIPSVFGKKIPSAFIYTMNVTEEQAKEFHLPQNIEAQEDFANRILGVPPKTLWAYNTLQFNDYSKYESSVFSESDKKAYQEKAGPICLKEAYDIGQSLVQDTTK